CLRPICKLIKLKDTRRTIPQNGLSLTDGFFEEIDTLLSTIQAHPVVWDTLFVRCIRGASVIVESVRNDVVHWQNHLDIVLLCLLYKVLDCLASRFIKQTVANLDILKCFLECKYHATANNQAVDFTKEIVDELYFI